MVEMSWLKQNVGKVFCNLDLTTEELDEINIDDYQTNINNRKIVSQNLDQSRRNNNDVIHIIHNSFIRHIYV